MACGRIPDPVMAYEIQLTELLSTAIILGETTVHAHTAARDVLAGCDPEPDAYLLGETAVIGHQWIACDFTGPGLLIALLHAHKTTGAVIGIPAITAHLSALTRALLAIRPRGTIRTPSAAGLRALSTLAIGALAMARARTRSPDAACTRRHTDHIIKTLTIIGATAPIEPT